MSTATDTITAEQRVALTGAGYNAGMADQIAAPSLSAEFRSVIAGLPVGTKTFIDAATAYAQGHRSGTYDRHTAFALNSQGLGTLLVALREAGHTVGVEQTGGFCMALTVGPCDGTVWVVAGEEDNSYYVARYAEADWYGDGGEPLTQDGIVDTQHVLDLLAFRRTATPA